MADLPTQADLFRIGRDAALKANSKLTREIIERDGTDANIMVASGSAVGDEVVGQLGRAIASLYLDSAKGKALDRLIFDRFNLRRKDASPAYGSASFSTTTATSSAFSIPSGTRLKTRDGRTFITTASATFPASSTGPVLVAMRSVQAGLDQQAAIGAIVAISDTIAGAPADLAVTNTLATAGAADEEKDDPYRARARRVYETARRGTLGAIEAGAMSVAGVKTATAFETIDEFGRPAQVVQLVVADEYVDGLLDVTPTPAIYQTQSQVLATEVFTALDDVRAAGIFVDVQVGVVTLAGVLLGLSFKTGYDPDSVALRARAQIVSTVNSLAPGESLDPADLVTALRSVAGLLITGDEIVSPTGVVVPQQLEILRTNMGLVRAVSLQPDRALQGSANPDTVGAG